jgi:hypothetical protein
MRGIPLEKIVADAYSSFTSQNRVFAPGTRGTAHATLPRRCSAYEAWQEDFSGLRQRGALERK